MKKKERKLFIALSSFEDEAFISAIKARVETVGFFVEKAYWRIKEYLHSDFWLFPLDGELCRTCLPPYQMPTKIVLTDALPKNAFGKHIRRCS